jgi:hypothetical protein
VESHHIYADPDPALHFNADPNPDLDSHQGDENP